ncbi:MAG: HypC/HybG/HupF family hydrogenase formation chaperone [Candidatus Bathyarchaeia archaeon]
MCLAVPGKVVKVEGGDGVVDIMGIKKRVNLSLIEDVRVGDWLVVHVGFAIQKLSEREARETLDLFKEVLETVS